MTLAELTRLLESKKRTLKEQAKERASYDYILADLVGRSISRVYNSSNKMPSIEEAYPTLFDTEAIQEQKATKQTELSALRFKMFAKSFNDRYKEVSKVNE